MTKGINFIGTEWKKIVYKSAACKMYKCRNDNIPFYIIKWYKLTKMKH